MCGIGDWVDGDIDCRSGDLGGSFMQVTRIRGGWGVYFNGRSAMVVGGMGMHRVPTEYLLYLCSLYDVSFCGTGTVYDCVLVVNMDMDGWGV